MVQHTKKLTQKSSVRTKYSLECNIDIDAHGVEPEESRQEKEVHTNGCNDTKVTNSFSVILLKAADSLK